MKPNLFYLIVAGTLLRVLLAFSLELGNDEVYYTTYVQSWQWNYFDHPPMVAMLIRLTSLNGLLSSAFFLRIGPILCSGAGTVFIYAITKKIADETSAFTAACLYNFSFYPGIIAGLFILPDAPELLFWLASIYLMIEIIMGEQRTAKFCLLGLSIGLCAMSKLSGVFLWIGFAGYILAHQRAILRNPGLYFAICITLLLLSPVIFWNISHHFVTYAYQSGRISLSRLKIQPDSFTQHLLGTIFYNNPVNILILCLSLPAWFRRRPASIRLCFWTGIPLVFVTIFLSLFNDTLPHWSGPAVTTLLIPASIGLVRNKKNLRQKWFLRLSGSFFLLVICGAMFYFYLFPFAVGAPASDRLGKGDISLDMTGWKTFSGEFLSLYHCDADSGKMQGGAFLLSDYWFPAAHLDYYIGRPNGIPLFVTGPLNNIHQFAWLNASRDLPPEGSDAYFIYPSNYFGPPDAALRSCFSGTGDSVFIPQYRRGVKVRNFVILRLRGCHREALRKQMICLFR